MCDCVHNEFETSDRTTILMVDLILKDLGFVDNGKYFNVVLLHFSKLLNAINFCYIKNSYAHLLLIKFIIYQR